MDDEIPSWSKPYTEETPDLPVATTSSISAIKPTVCTRIWQFAAIGANSAFITLIVFAMILNGQVFLGMSSTGDQDGGARVAAFAIVVGIFLGFPALAIYGALRFKKWMLWPVLVFETVLFIADLVYSGQPATALLGFLFAFPNAVLVYLLSKGSHEVYVGAVASSTVEVENEMV